MKTAFWGLVCTFFLCGVVLFWPESESFKLPDADTLPPSSLINGSVAVTGDSNKSSTVIHIFHTNDMHGGGFPSNILFPEEDLRNEGLFALATLIEERRKELWKDNPELKSSFVKTGKNDGILLLDAGDAVSGTYDDAQSQGANMMALMNSPILDYDAATIGNHSSDYGREPLMRNLGLRKHPVVLSNATDLETKTHLQGTVPWTVVTINGVRFGIFAASHDRSTRIDGVKMGDIVATAKKMIPVVRAKSDVVLMLAHLGLNKEQKWATGLAELDDNDPSMNIDVIIDGHSHAWADSMLDDDTIVAQAGSYAHCAGEIELVFDHKIKKVVSLKAKRHSLNSKKVSSSRSLQKAFDGLIAKVTKENKAVVVSNLKNFYFSKTKRSAGKIENKASELVARSLVEVPFGPAVKLADIGMVYQKGVRDNVAANDKGEITNDILHRIVPFGEPAVIINRTGSEIEKLVRSGLKKKFSWAGLQVTFSEKPAKKGYMERKLSSIKVFNRAKGKFEPLRKTQMYTMGTVQFFSKVFVRPANKDLKTYKINNKEVLLRFLKKYSKNRENYFSSSDPMWPCNIYE